MNTSLPDDVEAELQAQALALAEKALESVPEAARAAKIGKVSEGWAPAMMVIWGKWQGLSFELVN